MSPATKEQAIVKLKGIEDKIGYPAHWRDYSTVTIVRDSYLQQRRAGHVIRVRTLGRKDRQARRSRRVDHDAAHHQRLLRSAVKYH